MSKKPSGRSSKTVGVKKAARKPSPTAKSPQAAKKSPAKRGALKQPARKALAPKNMEAAPAAKKNALSKKRTPKPGKSVGPKKAARKLSPAAGSQKAARQNLPKQEALKQPIQKTLAPKEMETAPAAKKSVLSNKKSALSKKPTGKPVKTADARKASQKPSPAALSPQTDKKSTVKRVTLKRPATPALAPKNLEATPAAEKNTLSKKTTGKPGKAVGAKRAAGAPSPSVRSRGAAKAPPSKRGARKKVANTAVAATNRAESQASGINPQDLDQQSLTHWSSAQQELAQARTRWEHGDWRSLLALDPAQIAGDPERARLALILAAAHSHAGEIERAGMLARQAVLWGASRNITARVLISAAQNSLARVAAALEEDPIPHFEAAIRLVQPHADVALLARSRRVRELAGMGLLPEAAQTLEDELGLLKAEPLPPTTERLVDLQDQVTQLRALLSNYTPSTKDRKTRKPTVVIAGVPRSGTTWLYNATRLLFEANGKQVNARWHRDYTPDADDDADVHVVKVHNPEDLAFPYDLILTTNRPVVDRLASLIRMGWIAQDEKAVRNGIKKLEELCAFWQQRSDLDVEFEMIRRQPERVIQSIADTLKVGCNPKIAATISEQIDTLELPEKGEKPDLVPLLLPSHRSDGGQPGEIADWIRSVLSSSGA